MEAQDQNTLAVNDDNEASDEGEHASKQKRKYGKFVFQTFFMKGRVGKKKEGVERGTGSIVRTLPHDNLVSLRISLKVLHEPRGC